MIIDRSARLAVVGLALPAILVLGGCTAPAAATPAASQMMEEHPSASGMMEENPSDMMEEPSASTP